MEDSLNGFDLTQINVTDDPDFFNKKNNITPHIEDILEPIYEDLIKKKKSVLKKLQKYAAKYPKVPIFKNYLTVYYVGQGQKEKAYECNRWLLKEHPDYFYGIINLGNELLENEDFEGLRKLIGANFNMHEAIPSRDAFHIDEVVSFYIIVIGYLFATDRFEEAGIIEEMLLEFDPENPKLDSIDSMKFDYLSRKIISNGELENEWSQTVEGVPTSININGEVPYFHNTEFMDMLYNFGIPDYPQILKELPNVNLETIPQDLEMCIADGVKRYGYFLNAVAIGKFGEEGLQFPTHAFVLMMDFEVPNALETIFVFLRQDADFMEFWFYDIAQEILGIPLVKYGKSHLKACFDFMCERNIYTYNKTIISESLLRLAILIPEKRAEIIEHSRSLLNFYTNNFEDPEIGDIEFLGLFISELIDIKAVELIDEITILFEKGYVAIWICGTLKDVLKDINSKKEFPFYQEIFETSEAHYKYLSRYWKEGEEQEQRDIPYFEETFRTEPIRSEPKVGRNDPCPCGSGKKYKKCCINK